LLQPGVNGQRVDCAGIVNEELQVAGQRLQVSSQ